MSLSTGSTILVPVDVSDDETSATDLLAAFDAVDLVVLGYYPVPDQVAPSQVKMDREADAERRLDEVVTGVGREVTRLLVFTHDRNETIDRVADEHDCDAVLVPGSHADTNRVFVPIRGDENLDRILSLVADLLRQGGATATLFHAAGAGGRDRGQSLLDDAAGRLATAGIDQSRVETRLSTADDAETAVVEAAREFDLLVVGETEPSLTDRILGRVPARLVDEVDRPAFVVRGA